MEETEGVRRLIPIPDEDVTKKVHITPFASSTAAEYIDDFVNKMRGDSGDYFAKRADINEHRQLVGVSTSYFNNKKRAVLPEGIDEAGSKSYDSEMSTYSYLDVVEPYYNLTQLATLPDKSTPHASAIRAKVANVTQLGWDFIETDEVKDTASEREGDKKKAYLKKVKKAKAELKKTVKSLNDTDNIQEILTKILIDYYVTGNGYMEIGRTDSGQIGYIGHIPAISLRIRARRDGYVQVANNKLTFFRNFGSDAVDPYGNDKKPNEIIHIKNYSSLSGYYGVPEIVSALSAIAGTEAAIKYNLDYFSNKATPRYVIIVKGGDLSGQAQRSLMEFFETGVKGSNHRSIIVPLPSDTADSKVTFEMKPVEAGVQEASFSKYNVLNTATILMAHLTYPSKVAWSEGAGGGLAAARDADKTFKEQVTRPMQRVLEDSMVNRVIEEMTDMFLFKLNELSLTDEDTQSKIDERYLRNKTKVPNEIRARDGLPAIEGGDKVIELSARANADANTNTRGSRTRDADRSAGATDSAGEGRNEKGAGRSAE